MTAEMQGGFTIDDIQITDHIARGENSMILEAKWEGLRVAIKDLNFIVDQGRVQVSGKELQRLREHLINECRLNSYIRHPNMVRFLGIHSPLGTKIPYIVMERLNCNLNDFLLQYSIVPLEIKLHILHGIGLGLRYLHARDPPIIHKDLTSKNILLSNGIEVKISNLCTAQLIPSSLNVWKNHSVDFLPSLDDPLKMTKEVDVFSFGCVMIHTFCHQWPTPSPAVVSSNDPNEEQAMADSSSELDRRSQYLDKVPKSVEEVVIPLIASCLEDLPNDRPTAREVCDQLETLVVNRKCTLPDNFLEAQMALEKAQEQIKCQTAELQLIKSELLTKKTNLQEQSVEVKSLRLELSKLQVSSSHQFGNLQTSKSITNFWSTLNLTWQQCADLPAKRWVTSVAELDGKVYATVMDGSGSYSDPFVYDFNEDSWTVMPTLPCARFCLVTVHDLKQLLAIGGFSNCNGVVEISDKVYLWDSDRNIWVTPYPDMPTGRSTCSGICHGSNVIVVGGNTCLDALTITNAVEILHINGSRLSDSHWSTVEWLPYSVYCAVPLIIDNSLYVAAGYDRDNQCTYGVVTASLDQLLQSSATKSSGQVWKKLPDMPYPSFAINHYQGHLIIFTGDQLVEKPDEDKPIFQLIPLIHIYNPDTSSWNYVGSVSHGYYIGRSVHVKDDKILFIGGLIGMHDPCNNDDLIASCTLLTFTQND